MPVPIPLISVHEHVELHHDAFKVTFEGIKHPASSAKHPVSQFRGIKYASVPARFRNSEIFHSYPIRVDATRHGPICPQPNLHTPLDFTLYGLHPSQYPLQSFEQNEFECLNLNITVPKLPPQSSKNLLPVMVWIHGGGNIRGAGSRWVLDGGNLVRKSLENGLPMIIVTFNYRLGLFGFAASPQLVNLRASSSLPPSTSPSSSSSSSLPSLVDGDGNYGLNDSLVALQWLHKYLPGFGGDPDRITLCGEGKGALDVHALLLSRRLRSPSLVERVILQSGTCPPSLPNLSSQGIELARVLGKLSLNNDDQGVASLADPKSASAETLVKITSELKIKISPTDSSFFPNPSPVSVSSDDSTGQDLGISALLIGDTHAESSPYTRPAGQWTACSLSKRIKAVLRSPYKTDALLRAFEVGEDHEMTAGREEIAERVGELIGDCLVAYGVERLCNLLTLSSEEQKTKVYRFTFDQPSPFNASAHHAVDLVYLFGNIDFSSLPASPNIYPGQATPSMQPSPASPLAEIAEEDGEDDRPFDAGGWDTPTPYTDNNNAEVVAQSNSSDSNSYWGWGEFGHDERRVCEVMQKKWIEFVHGREVWGPYVPQLGPPGSLLSSAWALGKHGIVPTPSISPPSSVSSKDDLLSPVHPRSRHHSTGSHRSEGEIYIFGPTGDAHPAPVSELGWRRRVDKWREAFEDGGLSGPEVMRVGMELANGPVVWGKRR